MARVNDAGASSGPRGAEGEEAGTAQGDGRAFLKLTALVLLVAGGILTARLTPLGELLSREGIGHLIASLRGSTWAPVIFVAGYAAATAVAIPGTILTLAGGALFGFLRGTIYNTIAANIGANLAFLVARLLGREGIQRLAGGRLRKLDQAAEEHGFRGLLTLRLVPLVPFNALNFRSGLTAMSWPVYAVATAVGILPGTVVYTMFADALLEGSREASREALVRVLVSGGLLVFLSFLPTIYKKLKMKLPGSAALLVLALPTWIVSAPAPDGTTAGSRIPDHSSFTALLEEVAHPPLVDYRSLQERRSELDDYLARLGATDPARLAAADRDTRLAFWINAYNACMLKRVVDNYPIQKTGSLLGRIKNAVADRPANSVWQIDDVFTGDHCRVAGEERSQDEIEHEIIRPMGDPRIHFAVNCAARSCPPLVAEAYTADAVDTQLDRRVRAFVSDPRHFRLDADGDEAVLHLNRVLDWYKDDFGGVDGLRDFFRPYLSAETARVVADRDTEIRFFEYDWTLNDTGT